MNMKRKPQWLRIDLSKGRSLNYVKEILEKFSLNTVCEEANCPNRMECFSKKTATFMILGSECSRNCRFCNVSHGELKEVNPEEPENISKAILELKLKHVVITSVTRDDLPEGGASHFAEVVKCIKDRAEEVVVEVLIPDFKGDEEALKMVVKAKPEIINHNIETVPRLYPEVRSMATYERSLQVLKNVKLMDAGILTKSGIMVGLGEKEEEVIEVLKDLRAVGCDFLTIGQYLAPSDQHYPVAEYIAPEIFERYKEKALELGFTFAASAPLVRSSYNAAEMLG
ncbi:lipoic acid synthetase [Natronincola peptidivorans]|uniref:Lipoyl synthase n=1 Tax=Natronincola peptidivorans TaxID=426128 RepID=A0A1I0B040_9FIRM|nr:lipoyl synthase [Natronincola peptidivorans]SET00058.1 lipoic acid synthetase [Natronincola peptidivorans]